MTPLGLCDGTPEWWALWVEVLTRAPPYDDEDTDGFALKRALDPDTVRAAFAPSWYPQAPDPRPVYPWSAGPLVRYPYGDRGSLDSAPTDYCANGRADRDGLWTLCDGSCGG